MDRNSHYRKMHALLKDIGIESSKPFLLEGYGVEHTNELSDQDLMHLVDRLIKMKSEKNSFQDSEKKHWRSVILTLLNKYGIYVTNNDWSMVNQFLLQKKIGGKMLYEMSITEIQAACLRIRIILAKRKETNQEYNRLSQLN